MSAAELPECFQHFLAHWQALRQGAPVPTLADFLDRPVPRLQPWIGIFDIESAQSWPTCLSGTQVVAFFKTDFTGQNFADMVSDEARPVFEFALPEIGRWRCGLYHLNRTATSAGRQFDMHVLGLPLVRHGGKPSVVWMLHPEEHVDAHESGLPVHRIMTQRWIDLGHGVPPKFVEPVPSRKPPAPYTARAAAE